MARILGAIASSHTPTIGFAYDRNKRDDPAWAPIFAAYEPIQRWLAEKKPDVLFLVYNDHITSFFFDHYSAFALGIGDEYAVADEGGSARALPPIAGAPALAAHVASVLMAEEFDLSVFQKRALDHGVFSPLSMMLPHAPAWPCALLPLQVGVLQFPIPTARRCFRLGQALRGAIESFREDIGVALVERGGFEGAEVIMWLVVRGAMTPAIRCLHRSYYLPSMTGIATAIYEDVDATRDEGALARLRV